MGTSKSLPTPSGGRWTDVKREISSYLSGDGTVTPSQIINSTMIAAGGIPLRSLRGYSDGGGEGYGGGGGVGTVEGTSGGRVTRNSVARAVSGLGGFGAAIGEGSLSEALGLLGIQDLQGKPAGEVISRISEHLTHDLTGLERDLVRNALQQAIYSAAEIEGDPTYENLEVSLQSFIVRDGIEGLIELFLTQYVFDRVWLLIEDYVNKRTDNVAGVASMEAAVEHTCRSTVHEEIAHRKHINAFNQLDWFGSDGIHAGKEMVADLEQRLRRAATGGT